MKKKSFWRVLITALVVIIGFSGIAWFTWNLGKTFVGLVTAAVPSEEQKEEQHETQILNLPEVSFWTCQTGVYEDKAKALLIMESLRAKGWKAGITQEGPYTLTIGVFDTKEHAAQLGKALAEEGIETWVRKEVFPALSYRVSGSNAEGITALLKIANSLLSGKERETAKAEFAGDADFTFEGSCPKEFENLNSVLTRMVNTDYREETYQSVYRYDLLDLYLEYKLVTTKYLKKN